MSFSERRRTERILAPIRIRVIGNDMSGVSFAEETVTVSFNQQGARISLIHSLLTDDVVLVRNLENGVEEEFRVVGAFQQVFGNRREWGVEALNPESGIWGVEFSPHDDSAQPKVLIECAACQTAAQSTLSSIEYEVLLATGLISRHCDRCNETTRWKPSDQAVTPEILVRSKKAASQEKQIERRTRRMKLTMQLARAQRLGCHGYRPNARCFQSGPLLCQHPTLFTRRRDLYHPALCEESGPGGNEGEDCVDGGRHIRPVLRSRVHSLTATMAEGGESMCESCQDRLIDGGAPDGLPCRWHGLGQHGRSAEARAQHPLPETHSDYIHPSRTPSAPNGRSPRKWWPNSA